MDWSTPKRKYCVTEDGTEIVPPEGWKILPEGHELPSGYRAYDKEYGWDWRPRIHSTMSPIWAKVHGYKLAYAVPVDLETAEYPGWKDYENFTGVF